MDILKLEIIKSVRLPCGFCREELRICRTAAGDVVVMHTSPTCKTLANAFLTYSEAVTLKTLLDKAILKMDRGDA